MPCSYALPLNYLLLPLSESGYWARGTVGLIQHGISYVDHSLICVVVVVTYLFSCFKGVLPLKEPVGKIKSKIDLWEYIYLNCILLFNLI